MRIIIELPDSWRNSKRRPRKPINLKGSEWSTGPSGTLTVYDKAGNPVLSLAESEWTRVRRG